jgi:hypothetical protein
VAGSCEYGDETAGSGATKFVKYNENPELSKHNIKGITTRKKMSGLIQRHAQM